MMQDSTYQYLVSDSQIDPVEFKCKDFPIARAVMASSCVPIGFTPILIDKKYFVNDEDIKRVKPRLVDGGLYDNQGIHKIMQKGYYDCDIVITSDAGIKLPFTGEYNNFITVLLRTIDVFMARIKNVQIVHDVYENSTSARKEIAYISLSWNAAECLEGFVRNLKDKHITSYLIKAHSLLPEWVEDPLKFKLHIISHLKNTINFDAIIKPSEDELEIAQHVPTGLSSLTDKQLSALVKQGACLTEIQIKLYCPSLIHYHGRQSNQ
jgi:NTE family protein